MLNGGYMLKPLTAPPHTRQPRATGAYLTRAAAACSLLFLFAALENGCRRERDAGSDTAERPTAGPSASVAPPFATVAPSGSIPVALVPPPLGYGLRPTGPCGALHGGLRPPPRELVQLELQASQGDACAAVTLAISLVESLGRPGDYARALALATAAQNAGVDLPQHLCALFDLAHDRPGLASCYETSAPGRLALMLAFGDGVPRDLPRARRLSGSDSLLLAAINGIDPSAPPDSITYCGGNWASSNRDMADCTTEDRIERDYVASAARAAALDGLADDTRVGALHRAFLAYRDVDTERRWHAFLGGSGGVSRFCTERLKISLHETYDDVLQRLAGATLSPQSSTSELSAAARELKSTEASAGNPEFQQLLRSLHDDETAKAHAKLLVESSLRFREFEDVVAAIARDRLGGDAERGLRVYLRQARIGGLGQCPG